MDEKENSPDEPCVEAGGEASKDAPVRGPMNLNLVIRPLAHPGCYSSQHHRAPRSTLHNIALATCLWVGHHLLYLGVFIIDPRRYLAQAFN